MKKALGTPLLQPAPSVSQLWSIARLQLTAVRRPVVILIVLLALLSIIVPQGFAGEPLEAVVTPPEVSIGAFFDGTTLKVDGFVPAGCDAVVRIIGKNGDLHLRKKGRALGLLWMNLDTLTIENVPAVYLLFVPENFDQVAHSSASENHVSRLALASLKEQIRLVPDQEDKDKIFAEFLKLKKSEGLYNQTKGSIHYGEENSEKKPFQAAVTIPSRLKPGDYNLDVYAVKDGQIVAHTARDLPVKLQGFPAMLSSLAFEHGALYGILATLAAIFAGLLMGFFFGGGKGGH